MSKMHQFYRAVREGLDRPGVQRAIYVIAAAVFFAGCGLALKARPEIYAALSPNYVVLLLAVIAPGLIVLNSVLLHVIGRVAGADFGVLPALKISVLASAANYLPLPGGALLRIAAMKDKGASLKAAAAANIAAGIVWIGVTFIYSGIWAAEISPDLSKLLLALGSPAAVAGAVLAWRINRKFTDALSISAVSLSTAAYYGFGFWLALLAIGVDSDFAHAAVISSAGVIGSAFSIVPAGLGVREIAAAILAGAVGSDPATGFVASAILQVTTAATLAVAALVLTMKLFQKPNRPHQTP